MNIAKIYVDNFREFYDTVLPVKQVNFLVGENSTGKTSILKLIDLFSSSEFWFNGNFRTSNVDFSYYGDISGHTKNTSGLTRIGILYENDVQDGQDQTYSAVMLVISGESNKKTTLKYIRCAYNDDELVVQLRKKIGYKFLPKSNFSADKFKEWCTEEIESTGYTKQEANLKSYMDDSPYFIINTLSLEFNSNKDSEHKYATPPYTETVAPFTWVAPIRIKPQQTYDGNIYDYSSDGAHAPYVLKTIMSRRGNKKTKEIVSVLEKFGNDSGMFDSVKVKQFAKYGNSPFSIEVIKDGRGREITNVGYGVSQVLPIIIEVLSHTGFRFAIQQPEVHLHPKAQASLGSFFYDIAEKYRARFVIETHSDFIIDRFRQQVAKSSKKKPHAHVLFFEHMDGQNVVHSIDINKDGSYAENQPDSFRRFFFNEELKNISI